MQEYCLVTTKGQVINMSKCYGGKMPYLDDFMKDQGYTWVPVQKVSQRELKLYRYWSDRA